MLNKFILPTLIVIAVLSFSIFTGSNKNVLADILFQEQSDTVSAIEVAKKSVVSVIKTKDLTSVVADEASSSIEIKANTKQVSGGSGVIVSLDGLILTNKHVVADGDEYTVILHNGEVYSSKVVARDPIEDLAIIKIKSISNDEDISIAEFADSRHLKIGQTVIAMGYSLGRYKDSVTKGVVSGLNRSLVASGNNKTVNLSNIIQTDAAINLGNSGGILIDLTGRVIGISTAVETLGENVGFAIPSNAAKKTISSYKKYV